MDPTFFGLSRRPFPATPDTDLYYPSATHEAVVHGLSQALVGREPVVLVDGDPGTGKTLAVLRFLSLLADDVPTVFVPAPRFARPADFFQAILFDLGVPYRGLTEHELRLAVADQLLGGMASGSPPTVVVLDEAQHLSAELLEEVRLVGNLESRSAKAAFVVLCGSPTLRANLDRPEAAGLAQRLATRCRVEPMTADEATGYVRHQIAAADGDPDELLTDEALGLLTTRCHGVPRRLNQAAAMAFALCEAGGERVVDAEPVLEALARLGLAAEPDVVEVEAAPKAAKGRKRRAA
jgi:type II secretory pathway predicted ATPase ExeA